MAKKKCMPAEASGILVGTPAGAKIHKKVCRKKMAGDSNWPVALWLPNLCTCSLHKDCLMREGFLSGLHRQEVVHRVVHSLLLRWGTSYFTFLPESALRGSCSFSHMFIGEITNWCFYF